MARSLLKSMNVPGRHWGEAVRHAVYLLNCLPTKAMGERTPFEAWNRRKPHLGDIRVFGCTAHAKVTMPHLKKFDDRSQQMVYLGVEDGCKAHRLFDPRRCKIHVSRDVKFEENVAWNWSTGTDDGDPSKFTVELGVYTEQSTGRFVPFTGGPTGEPAPSTQQHATTSSTTPDSPVATPATGSPVLGGDNSTIDGPVRYKHIDDIMRDARRVVLEDGDMDKEAMLVEMEEPSCFREATGQKDWEDAMAKEIESIEKNSTWKLTTLPAGHKSIGLK